MKNEIDAKEDNILPNVSQGIKNIRMKLKPKTKNIIDIPLLLFLSNFFITKILLIL